MKVWYDKDKIDLTEVTSEKILFLPLFDDNVVNQSEDFGGSNWAQEIRKHVTYTSIDEADYILYHKKLDTDIYKFAQEHVGYNHKPIIVFYNDDNEKPTSADLPDNVFIFRTSIIKDQQKLNEISMPAWSRDFAPKGTTIRQKADKPVVSFCGALTHPIRKNAIDRIRDNTNINNSFVIRSAFWGGDPHNKHLRSEYISNIENSDMVLCARGAGNFSYRLYECLSMGRVPIIIDTDIVLPCKDVIDWSRFVITTPETICDDIKTFWNNISEKEYSELQQYCRHIYETYISPPGFVKYIDTCAPIRTHIKSSGMGLYDLLKDRTDIVGVEIGCKACVNATFLLETLHTLSLTGVDPYAEYLDWDGKIYHSDEQFLEKYALPLEERFGSRFTLCRHTSDDAVSLFEDESLDFVFVDGLHTYEQTLKDCINYYPKVKKGGIMCGHDYEVISGVTNAIREFSNLHNKDIKYLKSSTIAWYWIK